MGTATFSICRAGDTADVRGKYVNGGATTTNASTATVLDDGAAGSGSDITFSAGDILTIRMDEAARLLFGADPTATSGHYIPADETVDIEANGTGTCRVIDIA